jgi:ABC-type transport system involved in multi-copper enzyme maturation permease subunit
MTRLSGVIVKRLQLHVRSVAWFVTVILIMILFAASARRSTTLFDVDAAAFDADRLAHSIEADRVFQVYSQLSVAVDRAPAPLRLLARGLDDALPGSAIVRGKFGPTTLRGRQATPGSGPLPLDPAQVAGLFGSLLALLLTCDTLGREREQGTLQLALTYPVRRSVVLVGEYIAAMLLVLVPLVLSVLVFLTFAGFTGRVVLDREVMICAAAFILALGLLISTATGTGLLIASSARNATTSLSIGLFAWTLFAVVYPAVAPSLARLAKPVEAVASPASSDTLTKYWRKARTTASDARDAERVLQQSIDQADTYEQLAFFSPYSLYVESAEIIAGTGLSSYRAFQTSTERVAAQFTRWERDKLTQYPARGSTYSMSDPPLDVAGLEQNEVTAPTYRPGDAAGAMLILVLWNIVCFGAAHVRFSRYDPRA